tara:strand:- start:776 stop:988 length:213 start_codon:yes stop_codon:yes gene_type:complete
VKVGDLVEVRRGTDDPRLPKNRIGLIIDTEFEPPIGFKPKKLDVAKVLFSNGETLEFHRDYLFVVSKNNA